MSEVHYMKNTVHCRQNILKIDFFGSKSVNSYVTVCLEKGRQTLNKIRIYSGTDFEVVISDMLVHHTRSFQNRVDIRKRDSRRRR